MARKIDTIEIVSYGNEEDAIELAYLVLEPAGLRNLEVDTGAEMVAESIWQIVYTHEV